MNKEYLFANSENNRIGQTVSDQFKNIYNVSNISNFGGGIK